MNTSTRHGTHVTWQTVFPITLGIPRDSCVRQLPRLTKCDCVRAGGVSIQPISLLSFGPKLQLKTRISRCCFSRCPSTAMTEITQRGELIVDTFSCFFWSKSTSHALRSQPLESERRHAGARNGYRPSIFTLISTKRFVRRPFSHKQIRFWSKIHSVG